LRGGSDDRIQGATELGSHLGGLVRVPIIEPLWVHGCGEGKIVFFLGRIDW
jgi:hypothetical protein